jgi:hypothetical protein
VSGANWLYMSVLNGSDDGLLHLGLVNFWILPSSGVWKLHNDSENRDSSVGIAMDCGLDGRGLIPGRDKKFFFTPQRPDRLWSHVLPKRQLIFNGLHGVISQKIRRHLHNNRCEDLKSYRVLST